MSKKRPYKNRPETDRKQPSDLSPPGPKWKNPVFLIRTLVVLQLLLLAWQFSPALCTNGDNAKYYVLGESLVRGEGYRDLSHPDKPVETQYPVVFPLLIAFIRFISPTPLLAKALFSLLGAGITLCAAYLFKHTLGYLLFPFLTLLVFSGYIDEYSVILMSEIPFAFFSLLALILLNRSIETPHRTRLVFAAVAVSLIPVNIKSIGLAFSAAWIVDNCMKKRFKMALFHAIGLVVTLIIFRAATSWHNPYMAQLLQKNSYNPEAGFVTWQGMVQRIATNIGVMGSRVIRDTVTPFTGPFPPFVKSLFSRIMILAIVVGWIRTFFWKTSLISWYLFFYFGIMSLWQTQWISERFVTGILPFLYFVLCVGIHTIVTLFTPEKPMGTAEMVPRLHSPLKGTIHQKPRRWIILALLGGIALSNIVYQAKRPKNQSEKSGDWKNYFACADWIRTNTASDAVVMCRKPALFYLRSQRSSCIYPFSHDVEKILESIKNNRVSYLVLDNFFWTRTTARYLYPLMNTYPKKFKTVYSRENPETFILEYVGE